MSAEIEKIRSYMSAGDFEAARSRIQEIGGQRGYSPRLLLLKAACLQLSDHGGSLDEVERALLDAVEMDDEYVPAFLELGWFRLNVQDDAVGAKRAFDRARELLKKMTAEAFRGFLACAEDLRPNQNVAKFRSEFERDLIADLDYDIQRERPAG